MNFSAVILAGGQSRRMGQDKARLEVDGQPLLARALAKLREMGAQQTFISGRADRDDAALGCPVLLDREPGLGPLGGIERALQTATSPLVLVLAVDLPHVTISFLQKLMCGCDLLTGAVPQLNGALEPLVAIYPQRCHVIASDLLTKGRRAARDFAEACLRERVVRTLLVDAADARCFENWNTLADAGSDCAPLPARCSSTPCALRLVCC